MLEKRLRGYVESMQESYRALLEEDGYSYENELQLRRLENECEMVMVLTIRVAGLGDLYAAAYEMNGLLSDIERSWSE